MPAPHAPRRVPPGVPVGVQVGVIVRRAHLGLVAARGAESFLLGLFGLGVTLGAAVFSGAALRDAATLAVGAVAGLAAAATWWREHRTAPAAVARRMDAALRQDGALFTAWEVERDERAPGVARRLAERVGAGLRPARAVRAVLPSSALPIAAPFVALAILVVAQGDAREAASPASAGRWAGELAERLELARGEAQESVGEGRVAASVVGRITQARAAAAELERALDDPRRAAELDERRALADLERLDDDLAAIQARVPPDLPLARTLAGTRASADAARAELRARLARLARGGAARSPGAEGEAGDAARPGPGQDGAFGPAGSGSPLVSGGEDGRMVGSPEPGTPLPSRPDAGVPPAPPERGLPAASWWPREHDGVVERWLDAARELRAPNPEHDR